jgi:Tfp pilus assembly protein PilX
LNYSRTSTFRGRQGGATLLVALVMLVMLTLFAVTMIRSGNVGLKVVGNQQTQKLMEAAAAQAVEQVVSNLGNFDAINVVAPTTTVAQRVCINSTTPVVIPPATCPSGTQVDVAPVRCISTVRSQYDSLTAPMATYDNVWEIITTVTDSLTGARAVYHQGVKIRMLSNSCPGLST